MATLEVPEAWRVAVCAWLEANGINPVAVPLYEHALRVTDGLDGQRLIRCTAYVLTDEGRKQIHPDRADEAWMEPLSVPCKVEPRPELLIPGTRPPST